MNHYSQIISEILTEMEFLALKEDLLFEEDKRLKEMRFVIKKNIEYASLLILSVNSVDPKELADLINLKKRFDDICNIIVFQEEVMDTPIELMLHDNESTEGEEVKSSYYYELYVLSKAGLFTLRSLENITQHIVGNNPN